MRYIIAWALGVPFSIVVSGTSLRTPAAERSP